MYRKMSLVSRCLLWYEGNVTVPHSAEGDDCVCDCFFVDPRIFSPLSNFPIRLYTSKICHLFRVLMNDGVCECACTTLVLVCTGVVPSYAETRKKAGPIFFNLLIHGLIHGIWLYGSNYAGYLSKPISSPLVTFQSLSLLQLRWLP